MQHLSDVVKQEIWIMDVQLINLQQLCDAITLILNKISEDCFQHLIETVKQRINAALKEKGGQTQY